VPIAEAEAEAELVRMQSLKSVKIYINIHTGI
jgi:hypothetical protein